MNLIAALPRIDLTDRDFSECSMPHTYLYKRDLTGSKDLRGVVYVIIIDYFYRVRLVFNSKCYGGLKNLCSRVVLNIIYYYGIKINNF